MNRKKIGFFFSLLSLQMYFLDNRPTGRKNMENKRIKKNEEKIKGKTL